jgi:RNA polymerase sigma-70 factor (ECF subfamily)
MGPTTRVTDPHAEREARFHALVLPHLDRLLGFARRRLTSPGDAEDAVQEACARAWLALDELREAERARPWLYRILRGVLSDTFEKAGRRARLVEMTRLEEAHDAVVGRDEGSVFEEVAARITSEALHAALARLPEEFAVAVELHDLGGLKYHEIADVTGAPLGTVMSRIYRGRRLLAGAMAQHAGRAGDDGGRAPPRAALGRA